MVWKRWRSFFLHNNSLLLKISKGEWEIVYKEMWKGQYYLLGSLTDIPFDTKKMAAINNNNYYNLALPRNYFSAKLSLGINFVPIV